MLFCIETSLGVESITFEHPFYSKLDTANDIIESLLHDHEIDAWSQLYLFIDTTTRRTSTNEDKLYSPSVHDQIDVIEMWLLNCHKGDVTSLDDHVSNMSKQVSPECSKKALWHWHMQV